MKKNRSDNLDKEHIASRFKASTATYEESAIVQKELSLQLIENIKLISRVDYARVLEIGCCTGNLTEMLCNVAPIDNLFINDLVPDFCACTEHRIADNVKQVHRLPGDIEKALLPKNLDLVISSSTFQWMGNLPLLLENIATALNDTGYLAFSIFSPGTMGEIRRLTGRSLKYHTNEELEGMLTDHFRVKSLYSVTMRLFFPSVRAILHHIRETGVGGLDRNILKLRDFKEFERQYVGQFSSAEGLPVTYISTFVIAEKIKMDCP